MGAGRVGFCVVFLARTASAQEATEQATPPADAAPAPSEQAPTTRTIPPVMPAFSDEAPRATPGGCVPECRSGFVCVSHSCVSECNPPCPNNDVCDRGQRCIVNDASTLPAAIRAYEAEKRAQTVHRHDGFYARLGVNLGYAFDSAELRGVETKSRGFGGFVEWALGGNLTDHFVLALTQVTFGVFSPTTTQDGEEITWDHTDFFGIVGVVVDLYPDPTKGLHIAGTVGSGNADVDVRDGESTDQGLGLALGAGYDFWIGEQWSAGAGARVLYVGGADDDFGNHRAFIPMASFSVLYH